MRVLLVNTSEDIGGAAIACRRLMDALTRNGVEVRMLTAPKRRGWLCKAVERVMMLPFVGFSWRRSWTIDVNWLGTDITGTEDFKWADVIHLHWVNQGMLSVSQIGKIAHSGKRVVWTMHDLWPTEGVWHYKETPPLPSLGEGVAGGLIRWLNGSTLKRKLRAYGDSGVRFVTCSRWLMRQAEDSPLLNGNSIVSIPNPIDTEVFCRQDKAAARKALGIPADCRLVLFVSQKLTDERKGARYFVEALNQMTDVHVAVMGGSGEEIASVLRCPTHVLGYVSGQQKIASIYNAADVFVLPSLNDNLPNTIMEAMACGVPCVGFNIGGIPEMIDHLRNGFIADARNVAQLCEGIRYCLHPDNHQRLSDDCLRKTKETYSQQAVANRFKEVYEL